MKKLAFPILKRLRLTHFSLYKKADSLDIDLSSSVFCLAGANGLGKSTFIAIINYALTGIVKNPERQFTWFNSIPAFYNKSKGFAENYFDGRISQDDYDLAEVTLEFKIADWNYSVTRGFFEPDQLRSFARWRDGEESKATISEIDLNDEYKQQCANDIGLSDFDQFAFLQYFVFTFDETHQLLTWEVSLIERVLYLFFGVDSGKAKSADQLRKDINKYDSSVRNLQYQITKARNELESIQKRASDSSPAPQADIETFDLYKSLQSEEEEVHLQLKRLSDEIKETEVIISDLSLKVSNLRKEYSDIFNSTLQDDITIERDPRFIEILDQLKSKVFSNQPFDDTLSDLIQFLELKRDENNSRDNSGAFSQLEKLDADLRELGQQIQNQQTKRSRLIECETTQSKKLAEIVEKIQKIENDNQNLILSLTSTSANSDLAVVVKSYGDQIERLSIQKDEAYRARNKSRNALEPLEQELNTAYANAESQFIPLFNRYAQRFLGLDISIRLLFSSKGAAISINIEDAKRKDAFQLSESQRYFIDIALRMALINLCTASATFLVDTPEGSLDIAYESRAGEMFAEFADPNFKLILTANINTSQLLIQLADICKSEKMKLERMTKWTTLSDVQQEESERIEQAFTNIETKLGTIHAI